MIRSDALFCLPMARVYFPMEPLVVLLILLTACLTNPTHALAQAQTDENQTTAEIWLGVLDVRVANLRLELHLEQDDSGSYSGYLISLDQGSAKMNFSSCTLNGSDLTFEIKSAKARYIGQIQESRKTITGTFTQLGKSYALNFERKQESLAPRHVESWQGTMEAGQKTFEFQIRIFETEAGTRSAKLDSFSEKLTGLAIQFDDTHGFNFGVPASRAKYEGTLSKDGNSVEGHWLQGNGKFALNFKKITVQATRELDLKRPQTPQPPFDYVQKNVEIRSSTDDAVMLAGTITIPRGQGPFPAVILISGSGPQDRDGTVFGHKPFLVIADYFARQGIATLRYDERGIGKSTGDFTAATSVEFARDAEDLLEYLMRQPIIAADKVTLVGHSEGGILAPMIASRRNDIASLILLAGPTVPGSQIVLDQSRKIAKAAGAASFILDAQEKLLSRLFRMIEADQLTPQSLDTAIAEVRNSLPAEQQKQFILPTEAKTTMTAMQSPWFKFFLAYDPKPALEKTDCPVLVMIGENDLQVTPELNLPIVEKIFAERANKNSEIVRLEDLNHLFQTSTTGSPAEYSRIDETFSLTVLQKMVEWISQPGTMP